MPLCPSVIYIVVHISYVPIYSQCVKNNFPMDVRSVIINVKFTINIVVDFYWLFFLEV